MSYSGKNVLITGGAYGIGKSFSEYFATKGANVFIVDIDKDKLDTCVNEIKANNGNAVGYASDISKMENIDTILNDLNEKGLNIDTLINNVGIGHYSLYHETSWERLQLIVDVNVKATMYLVYKVLPGMLERDSGTIINLSSTGAFCGAYKSAAYTATKAFMTNFTEALDMEVANTNVRTLTAHPGATDTNFWEDAQTKNSPQYGNVKLMTPDETVGEFMEAYESGKASIIAGWQNRLMVFAAKFVPRELLKRMALKKYGG